MWEIINNIKQTHLTGKQKEQADKQDDIPQEELKGENESIAFKPQEITL